MPVEISNPSYINPGAVAGGEAAVITVANEAARLALLAANAQGRIVKQTGDFSVWCLKPNGSPSNSADWELIGYFSIGTMASQNANSVAITGGSISGVSLANITWADQPAARAALGLGNVNNTSDVNKPVSTAQQAAIDAAKARANHTGTQCIGTVSGLEAALAAKAPLASPAFTGIPTGPTAAPGTNTTQFATTAFVIASISGLGSGGGSWGSITGDINAQSDLVAILGAIGDDLAEKADAANPVFTGSIAFNNATFTYGASPDAAAAHRAALNAQIAPIQRTSPPLSTGGYAKSTLTFSGSVVTSGWVSLNGVSIQFIVGTAPYPPYSLVFDQWPYNGTVTALQAAAFVANTINRNPEVFLCQAVDNGDGTVLVVALTPGAAGNSIATTDNLNVAAWSAATLTGGSALVSNVTGTSGKLGQQCVVTLDSATAPQVFSCVRESPVLWQRVAPLGVAQVAGLQAALDAKHAALVSGTNIKTFGGQSLLGSGNISGIDVVGLVGQVNVSSNITIGDSHYGKLLLVTGARTLTLPSSPPDGARIAFYMEAGASVLFSGAVLLDSAGSSATSSVFSPAHNYLILEGIGAYWVARSIAPPSIGSTEILGGDPPWNEHIEPLAVGGASIDWMAALTHSKSLTGNTTFTFANVVVGRTITFYLWRDVAAGWGVNWPAGITWAGTAAQPISGQWVAVSLTATSPTAFTGSWAGNASLPASVTVPATATPPFLRVHGGILYVREGAVWKKAALSAL